VDALRYFLLHHYGGVYIDLDIFPYRPLTPLLTFPAVACRTAPTGISNDILFSTPQHPFFTLVLNRLHTYNRNLLLPYITIMYTTGPLFFSAVWIEYLRGSARGGGPLERLRVLSKGPVRGDSYGFFKNIQGGSWHGKDLELINWMGKHVIIVTLLGFAIGISVVLVLWVMLRRCAALFRSERWLDLQNKQPRVRQKAAWSLA
jgi:mannosyltransferase OCH1-like enzyme